MAVKLFIQAIRAADSTPMTAQSSELMVHDGHQVAMHATPLDNYFAMGGHRPRFAWVNTARKRRYIGTWEILNDRLYLIALKARLTSGQDATLRDVFPDYPERVFAHWYSGQLRLSMGALVRHVNIGFGNRFEREIMIDVERGRVVGKREQRNEVQA
jgi:hypothetical protein